MLPPARAAHSSVVFGDKLIVFAGKDESNEKLNDLWAFDLKTRAWEMFQSHNSEGDVLPRSGHSASLYGHFMIIFGGILDVCKELDDMLVYNI